MAAPRIPAVLPADLKSIKCWLVWRLTQIAGEKKPRKVPFYTNGSPRSGDQGTEPDRAQLVSFDEAAATCRKGRYSGVGMAVLPEWGIVALDFDNVVQDGVVDARVLAVVAGTYAEISPSGTGVRAFMRGSLASKKDIKEERSRVKGADFYPVEFFGHNGFVTVTGDVLPECSMWGHDTVLADLTPAALKLYEQRFGTPNAVVTTGGGSDDLSWLMAVTPKLGLTLEQVKQALDALVNDFDYDGWVKVGMAVHHETDGSEEGFELWDAWGQKSSTYTTEKYGRERWRSFGRNTSSAPTTFRHVLSLVKDVVKIESEQQVEDRYQATAGWRNSISEAADERTLRETICPAISQDARLGDVEREALAHLLRDTLKKKGCVIAIGQARNLIAPPKVVREQTDADMPLWAMGWCYVGTHDKFFLHDSNEWLTTQGFNAKFNREMPRREDGQIIKSASWYALEDLEIEHVNRAVYIPWGGDLFDLNGERCVNLYRPSSVPKETATLSAKGQEAVAVVKRHLSLALGGRADLMELVLAWMAHNVQKPGIKIRWSLLFKGIPGDGKSTIGTLLKAVMGEPNVKNISPEALASDFTSWGEGAAVGLFEEVRIVGENRYNIFNSIKPYITNDSVPILRKGKDEYEIVNVTNYMGFTNYSDALPLDDNDRRWLIVFLPFASTEELAAAVSASFTSLDAYFKHLNAVIRFYRTELRRWFLDYAIPGTFNPDGNAPMTVEKQSMIAMSMSDDEAAVREVLEAGVEGVGRNVLVTSCLVNALAMSDEAINLSAGAIRKVLNRIGFVKAPKMRWRGTVENVWVRGSLNQPTENLRRMLDATLQKTADCSDLF